MRVSQTTTQQLRHQLLSFFSARVCLANSVAARKSVAQCYREQRCNAAAVAWRLDECLGWRHLQHASIVVDCRAVFDDQSHFSNLRGHTGWHPDVVYDVVIHQHEAFKRTLWAIHNALRSMHAPGRAGERSAARVSVALVDDEGFHVPVALAWILHHVFSGDDAVWNQGVAAHHVALRARVQCRSCAVCEGPNLKRDEALHTARGLWKLCRMQPWPTQQ